MASLQPRRAGVVAAGGSCQPWPQSFQLFELGLVRSKPAGGAAEELLLPRSRGGDADALLPLDAPGGAFVGSGHRPLVHLRAAARRQPLAVQFADAQASAGCRLVRA